MQALTRLRNRRTLAALGIAAASAVGVSACEPGADGLSSVAVAMTTDQTGTRALERAGVDVQWMSCTSTVGEERGKGTAKSTPSATDFATVTCEGETKDGKDIRIDGKVTDERDGRCVRGDLTAKVAGRTVFQADVLGNCNAASPTTSSPDRPTVTVTVTTTVTAGPPGK
ncbi:hypothetical protein [Streptomyces spiramyceticus]|uniref:hypothetical protein n=1 Tax=Streptomyces spiramyceticus TaxID=299717 RepID=UPI00237C3B37|nr:hypothetical protein [Streptomyces spiramyceticus]